MKELKALIESGHIANLDLSGQVLEGVDFTGCTIDRVSFKKTELVSCRFRKAQISWCDFRYAKFQDGTFEEAIIDNCDFYRAFFDGVIIFGHSRISNCSINKTYFGDAAMPVRDNLANGRLLQQDEKAYASFLKDWHEKGTGERTNDVNKLSGWSPDEALRYRWAEAEDIFKNFSAMWTGKGYIADGNWAYVQGRRMERRRRMVQIADRKTPWSQRLFNIWKVFLNILSDAFFGYGESMFRMIVTYIVTVFLFAWVFNSQVSLLNYADALAVSLKNMAGMDSDVIRDVSPLVDMLNVVQTTIGIILTGIFGFILGNKIRNQ